MGLKEIKGVEIFSAGIWNGDKYTEKDLDEMVNNFFETKDTIRPYLKLGHDKDQKLLQADGLPAAGYIGNLYREGAKLIADFVDIPDKIWRLIENKAYRKVSSEIFVKLTAGEKVYDYLLGAVALLGADTPGVMNLNDILARFGVESFEALKSYCNDKKFEDIKVYDLETNILEGPMPKTEREIELETKLKERENALKALEAEKKEFSKSKDEHSEALKKALEDKEAAEKEAREFKEKAQKETLERQVESLISEKVISKGQRDLALQILGPELKTYTVGDKKDQTKFDLLKEFAKLSAKNSDVNLEENSEEGDSKAKGYTTEEVQKYADEHKLSFGDAYAKMFKGKFEVKKSVEIIED